MEPNTYYNEHATPDQNNNKASVFLIPSAIILAGGLIAMAVYFGGGKAPNPLANNQVIDPSTVEIPGVKDSDHILGSRAATITIIEYSDTECPFCKVFHNSLHQIMSEYSGQVAWVYRQFPIASLHSKAPKEAEATECVAELGGNQAFWSYLDKIFATTNSNDSLDPAQLPILAKEVGVDVTAFNKCLSSGKYTDFVKKSIEEGYTAGARGTPYSVIIASNGKKDVINGAEPIEMVRDRIDALLK